MLGHRSMDMTLVYARIANRVWLTSTTRSWKVDALYKTAGAPTESPAEAESPAMTRSEPSSPHARPRHVQPTGRTRLPD